MSRYEAESYGSKRAAERAELGIVPCSPLPEAIVEVPKEPAPDPAPESSESPEE